MFSFLIIQLLFGNFPVFVQHFTAYFATNEKKSDGKNVIKFIISFAWGSQVRA